MNNDLYIKWETGYMNIHMDFFFPCSQQRFKKLLKVIALDWQHEDELKEKYDTWASLTLIELLYYGYFGAGNNVNWMWLKSNDCWPGTHPMNFRYTRSQFEKILREGKVDVGNVIIN